MNPHSATAAKQARPLLAVRASAVSRDGVRVSSAHDISQSASAAALP